MESPTVGNAQKKSAHVNGFWFDIIDISIEAKFIYKGISTALNLTKVFICLMLRNTCKTTEWFLFL